MGENYTTLFLVTYKKLSSRIDLKEEDYKIPLKRLRDNGHIVDHRYEHDKKHVLHVHVIYECRNNPYIRKFVVKGYNVNFTPIYDNHGAVDYINKCNPEYRTEVVYMFGDAMDRNKQAQNKFWKNCIKKTKPTGIQDEIVVSCFPSELEEIKNNLENKD